MRRPLQGICIRSIHGPAVAAKQNPLHTSIHAPEYAVSHQHSEIGPFRQASIRHSWFHYTLTTCLPSDVLLMFTVCVPPGSTRVSTQARPHRPWACFPQATKNEPQTCLRHTLSSHSIQGFRMRVWEKNLPTLFPWHSPGWSGARTLSQPSASWSAACDSGECAMTAICMSTRMQQFETTFLKKTDTQPGRSETQKKPHVFHGRSPHGVH